MIRHARRQLHGWLHVALSQWSSCLCWEAPHWDLSTGEPWSWWCVMRDFHKGEWTKWTGQTRKSRTKEGFSNRGGGVPRIIPGSYHDTAENGAWHWQRLDSLYWLLSCLSTWSLVRTAPVLALAVSLQDCWFRVWTGDASTFDGSDTDLSVTSSSNVDLMQISWLSPSVVIPLFGLLSPLMKTSRTRAARSRNGEYAAMDGVSRLKHVIQMELVDLLKEMRGVSSLTNTSKNSNPAVAAALSPWIRLFTPIVPRRSLNISFY